MGDAPGHVRPGRLALRRKQLGDVVEGDDEADDLLPVELGGDAHEQVARGSIDAREHDRTLAAPARTAARFDQQLGHFGHGLGQFPAPKLVRFHGQKRTGRTVRQRNLSGLVEADDPGRNAAQHGFDEPVAVIELAVRLEQLLLLALQFAGHAVERLGQGSDLVGAVAHLDPGAEVARADPLGGEDQLADRPGQVVGEGEADPDGSQQKHERDHDEDQGEGDLEIGTLALQFLVKTRGVIGGVDMREHPRIDQPPDVEVRVGKAVEAQQRAHPVLGVGRHDDDLAVLGLLERPIGNLRVEVEQQAIPGPSEDPPGAVEHDSLGQRAHAHLGGQGLVEAIGVEDQRYAPAVEVLRHGQGVGADRPAVLLQVGLGHHEGFLDRGAHPVAEPALQSEIEQQNREGRDHDGRRDRDQTEQADQAHMQLGAGQAPPVLDPEDHQTPRDQGA